MKPPPWNKKWWCDDMIGFVFAPIQNIVVLCRWQRSWRWTNERPWPFQRRQKRERGEFLTCVTKILYWGTLQWHQSVEEKTRFSLGSTDQTNAWLHYAAAFRVSHWAAMQSLFERGFAPSFFCVTLRNLLRMMMMVVHIMEDVLWIALHTEHDMVVILTPNLLNKYTNVPVVFVDKSMANFPRLSRNVAWNKD